MTQRLSFEELRILAVAPHEAGAYTRSAFGEGNIGIHTHDGGVTLHVWVEGCGRVAVLLRAGTVIERPRELLPANVQGLYDLLPPEGIYQ